jgi:hypothetical protein
LTVVASKGHGSNFLQQFQTSLANATGRENQSLHSFQGNRVGDNDLKIIWDAFIPVGNHKVAVDIDRGTENFCTTSRNSDHCRRRQRAPNNTSVGGRGKASTEPSSVPEGQFRGTVRSTVAHRVNDGLRNIFTIDSGRHFGTCEAQVDCTLRENVKTDLHIILTLVTIGRIGLNHPINTDGLRSTVVDVNLPFEDSGISDRNWIRSNLVEQLERFLVVQLTFHSVHLHLNRANVGDRVLEAYLFDTVTVIA